MTNLNYLGFIKKTHGYKGAVKISVENSKISFSKKEPLMLMINKKPVPFFIDQFSKTELDWNVQFEDINSVEEADELVGIEVYLESKKPVRSSMVPTQLIGYMVVDEHSGHIGSVIDFYEKPGQSLLLIEKESKEYYIPWVEEFIVNFDHKLKKIHTNLPEGLLSIND